MQRTIESRVSAALQAARAYLQVDAVLVGQFTDGEEHFPWIAGDAASFGLVARETTVPLEHTYCARVAAGTLSNLVSDTREDSITQSLSGTQALEIGAYMGVPLRLREGGLYGVLCALHHNARPDFDLHDVRFLEAIAAIVAAELSDSIWAEAASREASAHLRVVLDEERYYPVFQSIVELASGDTVGFEALTRFDGDPRQPPNAWFAQAADAGLGHELELATVRAAVAAAAALPQGAFLSVNCSPAVAASAELHEVLATSDRQLIVELTEHDRVTDYAELQDALASLRRMGVRVAVDDAGAGFSSLTHIVRLAPDYIKLDVALTHDIDGDPVRRSLTTALAAFASDIGAVLVAEGIETKNEQEALTALGVSLGQGFYLGHPARA